MGGLNGEDMSSSPMYITVDTNEVFTEMPQTVVVDNESYILDSGQSLDSLGTGQNLFYMDAVPPLSYGIQESNPFEIQGKISVVESSQSNGLFCGECSMRLNSPIEFFQHWVNHHCQLEQPTAKNTSLPSRDPNVDAAGPSLTMERCNLCNHIFVEGTNRYKNHLLGCEKKVVYAPNMIDVKEVPPPTIPAQPSASRAKKLKKSQGGASQQSSSHKFVCGVCDAGVKTVTAFFLHWLESHQGLQDILQEVWQCRGCSGSKLFPDCLSLAQHAKNHPTAKAKDYQVHCCPIPECQGRLESEVVLGQHLGQFHRQLLPGERIQCQACSSLFNCTKEAYKHFKNEHQVTCGLCFCDIKKETSSDHYLSVHHCEVIWNRNLSLQKVSKSPQVSRICTGAHQGPMRLANGAIAKVKPSVQAKSTKIAMLKGNLCESGEDKGFKCSKCTQVFTNLKVLEKHFFSNHLFPCKFCAQVMDKDEYGQHLRQHLTSERRKTKLTSSSDDSQFRS